MKTIDFFQNKEIAAVHRKMNIPRNYYADFDFSKKEISLDWEEPLKQGLEIKADDENFGWSEKGLFYNGARVKLYIRDQMIYLRGDNSKLPRYHITWCKTLADMHHNGKYEKYGG